MWGLLKRLSTECWGQHDWIYRANTRGLWLECRRCGLESPGLELAAPRYHHTQDGLADLHRLDAPPTLRAVPVDADTARPRRFERRRAHRRAEGDRPMLAAAPPDAAAAGERLSDAERRWLHAWRALTPDERVLAERMVDGLSLTRCATHHFAPRDRQPQPEPTPAESPGRLAG